MTDKTTNKLINTVIGLAGFGCLVTFEILEVNAPLLSATAGALLGIAFPQLTGMRGVITPRKAG